MRPPPKSELQSSSGLRGGVCREIEREVRESQIAAHHIANKWATSPDMSPIENVWSTWEACFGAMMTDPDKLTHGNEQVIEGVWKDLLGGA